MDFSFLAPYIFIIYLMTFIVAEANPVDVKTASEIGAKFLRASTNVKSADNLKLVATYSISRGEAAFYVFNADNGYVIVAADDCATPILAYSDEEIFDVDNIPPQYQEYLEGFVERIQYGIENNLVGDEDIVRRWNSVKVTGKTGKDRNTPVVGPLLTSIWHQNAYYNDKCPVTATGGSNGHVVAGCVATAMGQVMYYHKKPVTGQGSHRYTHPTYGVQSANFGATTYDWANMTDQLTGSSTPAQIAAVATLLRHCGVSVNMNYSTSGSGANSRDVPNVLRTYFRYSNEISEGYRADYDDRVWLARVKACLDINRPVYYSGTSVNATSGNSEGHAFVCDGYDTEDMLHMNWGWNGSGNCYVAVDVVKPSSNSYQFKYNNYAIFNIHPSDEGVTQHTVAVSSNNPDYGTVSGGGSFDNGDKTTVTATPSGDNVFCYWLENGGIASTKQSYEFNVLYSRNLIAVFAEPNSITIGASVLNSTGGSVSGGGNNSYGQSVTLTATPSEGYTFMYWLDAGNAIVSLDAEYTFKATESCNLTARFALSSEVCEITYTLADEYLDGWRGNKLNLTYEGTYTESLTLDNISMAYFDRKAIHETSLHLSWTLGAYIEGCKFSIKHKEGEVFYDKLSVTPSYSDDITVYRTGGSDRVFNGTSSNLWSVASNWENGTMPNANSIVGISHDVVISGTDNITVATLNLYENVTLTIAKNGILTVMGAIAQLGNSEIVIEEGGQLVYYFNRFAHGHMKKSVSAWNPGVSDKGWYAISTPMYETFFSDVENLTNDTYNVYRYNEATMTWENCQSSANQFNKFEEARGYLYRRNTAATLDFYYYFKNAETYYQLSNAASNSDLRGFNLIGNPYPHNIYKGNGAAISNAYLTDGFYTLSTDGTWTSRSDKTFPIKPCQAILVQAQSSVTNDILTIGNTTSDGVTKDYANAIQFVVTNSNYEDVAYALFKEGEGLNKIEHRNEEAPMLYIRYNDEDFAVADVDDTTTELDLNFKAATTGRYTLKINAEGCFGYLHLIDRLTGNDVDMLAEDEYSFVGSPSDAADRFIVKLSENAGVVDNSFAYQSGADVIICGDGTLQIFDVTGRMISTQNVNGVETFCMLSQGVYIFRLLGNEVKTQKIVIE